MTRKILIASGGTGGHIFPAIVFGKNLQDNGHTVRWLCGSRDLERTIYNSSGIEPVCLPLAGSPLGTRSPAKVLGRISDVFKSLTMTSSLVASFNPDEIFLFGGYISFAPLIIAKLRRIPVTLHEQNTIAGRVARLASRLGARILTGWPVCYGIDHFEHFGIPVREPQRLERQAALHELGLSIPTDRKVVCVAGGSLGSGPLSEILKKAAALCSDYDFVFLSSKRREDVRNMHFIPSQWNMNAFYSASDVLVCRAGGSTLAEALKWQIPTITIPWPGAMDNHQVMNAQEFVKLSTKAQMFPESGSPGALADAIHVMLQCPKK